MFRRRQDREKDPARRAAQYQVDREAAADAAAAEEAGDAAPDEEAAGAGRAKRRMDDRALWVDTVVDQAIRRGEFDDLPLAGKPIPGLRGTHDPDWWLKNLVEREQITGVLPAAQLRRDDAELDETLDREPEERRVRDAVEEFNARVIDARRQLMGGPPVVTPTRDVEREVQRWRERRRARGIF
ncbi:DUF1992 domain-containing protein [Isoptericola sp. NPDC056134]|uniref:DnaJ family domain-containing protein n=1 Tax=Isoptericola sp. NPDC056134 TaxID=3345723 RepID=UPI0035ECF9AF